MHKHQPTWIDIGALGVLGLLVGVMTGLMLTLALGLV